LEDFLNGTALMTRRQEVKRRKEVYSQIEGYCVYW